jgi:hypothetical protein
VHLVYLEQSTPRLDLLDNPLTNDTVEIRLNRGLFLLVTIFFAAAIAVGLARAITAGNGVAALIVLVVLGGPYLLYARGLLRRGAAIVLESDALSGFRVGRRICWTDVGDIYVSQRQGAFNAYHHLVLTVRREDGPPAQDASGLLTSRVPVETVELSIDQLAMPWEKIVTLVEDRYGEKLASRREAGLFGRRA